MSQSGRRKESRKKEKQIQTKTKKKKIPEAMWTEITMTISCLLLGILTHRSQWKVQKDKISILLLFVVLRDNRMYAVEQRQD